MNFDDIKWNAGKKNAAGVRRLLFCPAADIATMPPEVDWDAATDLADLAEITTAIVCAQTKQFYEFYGTLDTLEVKHKLVGPRDGKGYENTIEFSTPGNEPQLLGMLAFAANLPGIWLALERNGKWRMVGDVSDPAYFDDVDGTSGKAISDGRVTKIVIKASSYTPPMIYNPTGGVASLLIPQV